MFNEPPITTDDIKIIGDLVTEDLQPFIDMAVNMVTEVLSESGLTDPTLRDIAKYISAHFAFLKEGQVKSEKIGDSSTTFNMTSDLGLQSTVHGQTAINLDTSGTLWKLSNRDKDISGGGGGSSLAIY